MLLFGHRKSEWGIGVLRGNLLIIVLSQIIWQFSVNIGQPYIALYVLSLGGTAESIGFVNSLGALAGIFLYPLGGYIADMKGRVQLINIATFGYACSFLVFAYAPNWQALAVASFLRSLVLFYAPILTVLQADSVSPGKRSSAFAIALSVPGAVGIFSPVLGGYLMDTMGVRDSMRLIYTIGFGAGIVVALLRNWGLTETLKVTKSTVSYRNFPKLLLESYKSFVETLRWMPQQIRVLAVMAMCQIFFAGVSSPYYIVYAYTIFGISTTQWGLTSMIQGITRLILSIPAGRIMDTHSRKKILIPCMLWTIMMPIVFLQTGNFLNLVLMAIVISCVNIFLMPGFQSLLADYTPRERRGRVTSSIGAGNFFIDIRGGAGGGGGATLLFIPSSIAQLLGGDSVWVVSGQFFLFDIGGYGHRDVNSRVLCKRSKNPRGVMRRHKNAPTKNQIP
jgi:DHA1 family multidrug resistance protein-like MFS transporter